MVYQLNGLFTYNKEKFLKIKNPIMPKATLKVLHALNIKNNLVNNNFLNGKNIFDEEIKIKELSILFKKYT